MFEPIHQLDVSDHKRTGFIDIYLPIAGHKAVQYWWNEDKELGGFWEPWETGMCAWRTAKEAYLDAKMWAEAEGIPYIHHPELEENSDET